MLEGPARVFRLYLFESESGPKKPGVGQPGVTSFPVESAEGRSPVATLFWPCLTHPNCTRCWYELPSAESAGPQ